MRYDDRKRKILCVCLCQRVSGLVTVSEIIVPDDTNLNETKEHSFFRLVLTNTPYIPVKSCDFVFISKFGLSAF